MIIQSPATEVSGLCIPISLDWFMAKHSSGLDPCVTISKDYSDLLQKSIHGIKDQIHFEPVPDTNLTRMYRLSDWNGSISKAIQRQKDSEIARQKMILEGELERKRQERQFKFAKHLLDHLTRTYPNWVAKQGQTFMELLIAQLIQDNPAVKAVADKIGYAKIKETFFTED